MNALRARLAVALRSSTRYPNEETIKTDHNGRTIAAQVVIGDIRGDDGALLGHVFTWRHTTVEVERGAVTQRSAAELDRSSAELGAIGHELQSVTAEATVQSDHLVTAARELTDSIREIAAGAAAAAASSQQAAASTQDAARRMDALMSSIGEIAAMADLISGIAEQTNLLALNATIEAARAGSAGAGFAVVAGEVKELSRNTASATKRIRDLVEDVAGRQTSIAGAVEEQSAVATTMADGVDRLGRSTAVAAATARSALSTAGALAETGIRLRALISG